MSKPKPRHRKKRKPLAILADSLRSMKLMAYELQRMSSTGLSDDPYYDDRIAAQAAPQRRKYNWDPFTPHLADTEREEEPPQYIRSYPRPGYYSDSLGDDEGDEVIRRAATEITPSSLPPWAGQGTVEPSIAVLWEVSTPGKPQEPSSGPISTPLGDSLDETPNAPESAAQPAQDLKESQAASSTPSKRGTKPYMIDRKNHVRVRETDRFIGDVYRRLADGQWVARYYPSALARNAKTIHPGGGRVAYRTRAEAVEALWRYYLLSQTTD